MKEPLGDFFMETDRDWLHERQRQYDLRAGGFSGDPASTAALTFHQQIVNEIDSLPVTHGGRGHWWLA